MDNGKVPEWILYHRLKDMLLKRLKDATSITYGIEDAIGTGTLPHPRPAGRYFIPLGITNTQRKPMNNKTSPNNNNRLH